MNFTDTIKSVELILATGEVPLIVGESGIGKTALAKKIAEENNWSLIVIDGNLLKEGEIGGLPTIESYVEVNEKGEKVEKKTTGYAVHNKLREIDEEIVKGKTVLLFIDEINRCEHTVQQELMNLILNREINGYQLDSGVKIVAAMNPSDKYGTGSNYQVVDMDAAQENRFVWLYMEPDYLQWIDWAIDAGIEKKVIEFISTFPEYLQKNNEDDISATPRSYERISKAYTIYKEQKDTVPRSVFVNVLKGNVGRLIAEEFISFIESEHSKLLSYEDIFKEESLSESIIDKVKNESHTRLYISAKNILKYMEAIMKNDEESNDNTNNETNNETNDDSSYYINRFIELLNLYPVDLRVGIMKDIRNGYPMVYQYVIENEAFVELYFDAYASLSE